MTGEILNGKKAYTRGFLFPKFTVICQISENKRPITDIFPTLPSFWTSNPDPKLFYWIMLVSVST